MAEGSRTKNVGRCRKNVQGGTSNAGVPSFGKRHPCFFEGRSAKNARRPSFWVRGGTLEVLPPTLKVPSPDLVMLRI